MVLLIKFEILRRNASTEKQAKAKVIPNMPVIFLLKQLVVNSGCKCALAVNRDKDLGHYY
jgi:hypothetical protein